MPTEKKTWIWKLDPKILNEVDKYVLVEKEDLELSIKRETWLLEELYHSHYNNKDYDKHWNDYLIFKKKYLEEDKP
ncbi:hypothetical protein LCGC14_2420940 [marine sediment metagenome]|uniref:Uncharacterized protein n=1 Tax=marine sediment metagenome TaxID=412755 RepID=A0A0F9E1R3_9ZZZZ